MRYLLTAALLLSLCNSHAASPVIPKNNLSADGLKRYAERQQRLAVMKGYADAHKNAQKESLSALDKTVVWLTGLQYKENALTVLKEIALADPNYSNLAPLKKGIEGIADAKYPDSAANKELTDRLARARKSRADALLALARKCFEAKLLGYAHDLIAEILVADPDNQAARNALAQGKIGDRWYTAFEATQIKAGKIYLPAKGWVFKQAADRVQKGEWFEQNKWMTMAEANKLHSNRTTPWEIETASFTLKSTDTLENAIKISERLERIRKFCFREYLEFFTRGSGKQGSQLLFNQSAPKKMLVYFFGTKADYDEFILKDIRGDALLINSAGFYKSSLHASYFYHGENFGSFLYTLMQHEVTHQILGEYTSGGGAPVWLTEGVADVLGHSKLEGDVLVLPSGIDHPDVLSAARLLQRKVPFSAAQLMSITHEMFHLEPGRRQNYFLSGALCRFLLEFQDGIYAADFLEFLYDSYKQARPPILDDYIGMNSTELDKHFKEYLVAETAKIQR